MPTIIAQLMRAGTEIVPARRSEPEVRNGTPGVIRTPDPLLRRQVLYPAELRARFEKSKVESLHV